MGLVHLTFPLILLAFSTSLSLLIPTRTLVARLLLLLLLGNSTGIPPGVRRLTRTRTRRLPAPVVVGAGKRAGKPQGTRTDTRGGIPAGIEVR